MKKSLFRIKLDWLSFFIALFGVIYLTVYHFTGSDYQAYRTCLFALALLIEPIIVIFTHQENTDKPLVRHSKKNEEEYEEQEYEEEQDEPQHTYKYAYGSRYEDLHVHF